MVRSGGVWNRGEAGRLKNGERSCEMEFYDGGGLMIVGQRRMGGLERWCGAVIAGEKNEVEWRGEGVKECRWQSGDDGEHRLNVGDERW